MDALLLDGLNLCYLYRQKHHRTLHIPPAQPLINVIVHPDSSIHTYHKQSNSSIMSSKPTNEPTPAGTHHSDDGYDDLFNDADSDDGFEECSAEVEKLVEINKRSYSEGLDKEGPPTRSGGEQEVEGYESGSDTEADEAEGSGNKEDDKGAKDGKKAGKKAGSA